MTRPPNPLRTHGLSTDENGKKTPEFVAWQSMLNRCRNPKAQHYPWYGGRGITVCERWASSFPNFLSDVGPRPSAGHSLDRFPDNDGNYEPGNVRWATTEEQALNKRNNIEIGGKHLFEVCAEHGLNRNTVKQRIRRGWPQDKWLIPTMRPGEHL